jgi:hypothetical protein
MALNITFKDFHLFTLLSKEEIKDMLELFYRGGDRNFVIIAKKSDPKFAGQADHDFFSNTSVITLVEKNIRAAHAMKHSCGANFPHSNIKVLAATTLAHEVQHINQMILHKRTGKFFGHLGGTNAKGQWRMQHYGNRACETDARAFADEKLSEICAYFNVECPKRERVATNNENELDDIIDVFSACDSVSMDDIKEELRSSKILSPSNVAFVKTELATLGITVTK